MTRIPPHLNEDDLLALVEGQKVAQARVIRDAVQAEPEVGRLLLEMRLDRAALKSLAADAVAPAGLLAEVEARLEREAIAGLVHAESGAATSNSGSIPISSVVVTRTSPWQGMFQSRTARRFALAASLVVVGGTVGLFAVSLVQKNFSQRNLVAKDDSRPVVDPSTTDAPVAPVPMLAANPDGSDSAAPDILTPDPALALATNSPDPASPVGNPAAATPIADAPTMTLARAVELAGEGRLVIRVRSASAAAVVEEVRAIAARSPREVKWQALESAPEIVMALAVRDTNTPNAPASRPRPDTAITGNQTLPVPVPPETQRTIDISIAAPEIRPLYTVEFRESERTLESLMNALGKGKDSLVEFVELEHAVNLRPALDPAAMLWWSRPSEWTPRTIVPVVLEER